MRYYQSNPDEDLRELEREYATTRDPVLLKRIHAERRRAGLLPHPDSRVIVASDRATEMNYQAYMFLRDNFNLLFGGFTLPEPWRLRVATKRREIGETLALRQLAGDEVGNVLRKLPPRSSWLEYCNNLHIPVRQTLEEREEFAFGLQQAQDALCPNWLEEMILLGLFAPARLIAEIEHVPDEEEDEDEDEQPATLGDLALERVETLETILLHHRLCKEEILRALANLPPTDTYKIQIGDKHWWSGS